MKDTNTTKNPKKVMKKKTKILIRDIIFGAVVVAAIVALVLVIVLPEKTNGESDYAKEHAKLDGHGFLPQWSTNPTHHWHDCKHKTCTETIDKGEHTWDDGTYITRPTPEYDGQIKYVCTVCKRSDVKDVTYDEIRWSGTFSENEFENFSAQTVIVSPYTYNGTETKIYNYTDYYFTKNDTRVMPYSIIDLDGSTDSEPLTDLTGDAAASIKNAFSKLATSLMSDLTKYNYDASTDTYSSKQEETVINIALDGKNYENITAKDLKVKFEMEHISLITFSYVKGGETIKVSINYFHFNNTEINK